MAKSKSFIETFSAFRLAANSEASLAILARSAPENPGVTFAIDFRFIAGSSGKFFV